MARDVLKDYSFVTRNRREVKLKLKKLGGHVPGLVGLENRYLIKI